jgi:hypothetical protein
MSKDFDYKKFVRECYEGKKDQEIHNASEENALLLFSTLFDKAIRDKEDVRIISNQLLRRFYNKLTTQLQKVLENGNTVSIIVEKEIDDQAHNTFYQQSKKNLKIAYKLLIIKIFTHNACLFINKFKILHLQCKQPTTLK